MCGCSGTSVKMSSKFMFNVNNARLNSAMLNSARLNSVRLNSARLNSGNLNKVRFSNRSFRISAPRKVFQNQKVTQPSFSNKKVVLKKFYFSY
jgi:uncharacterized protein YjbI with pentapeptide repeats